MIDVKNRMAMLPALAAVALGSAVAYLLLSGKQGRMKNYLEHVGAIGRKFMGKSEKLASYAAGEAYGIVQETIHMNPPDNPTPDDGALKERVQSEIFKNPETSREYINVGVVNGVVVLRGELPHPEDINALIARVKAIPDVREVESYLHLPNTVAPNKLDSIDAQLS